MINKAAFKEAMKSICFSSLMTERNMKNWVTAYEAAKDAQGDDIAKAIHYPQCWDTVAYPSLHDALNEIAGCIGCNECEAAILPADADQKPTHPEKSAVDDREAFEAKYRHLDLDKITGNWCKRIYKHSHIEALWEGWQAARDHYLIQGTVLREENAELKRGLEVLHGGLICLQSIADKSMAASMEQYIIEGGNILLSLNPTQQAGEG